LIVRKIIKIVATRCCILKLKCTKFDFGWGSASDPAGGAYSFSPDLAVFKGPTSKGSEEWKDDGREGRGRGRKEEEGTYFSGEGEGREKVRKLLADADSEWTPLLRAEHRCRR